MTKWIIGLVVLIVIVGGAGYVFKDKLSSMLGGNSMTLVSSTKFACDNNKTIDASFYQGQTAQQPQPGQPPVPTGSVKLALSDGRNLSLPQTISADGARYANADESIVFWNKGDTAFMTEGASQTQTFANCITADASGQPTIKTYASSTMGISLQYPPAFTANDSYANTSVNPKKPIHGVQFTVPATMATGTNLSSDSYVSVEQLPRAKACTADIYLAANVKATTQTINGVTYSVASSTDAGAGNRYEETVYALTGSQPCTAVRYFIHYGAIENYPAGAVQAFDRSALLTQFDAIRDALKLTGVTSMDSSAGSTTTQ